MEFFERMVRRCSMIFHRIHSGASPNGSLVGFFNFPDNYISLVNYFKTLPILTVFSAATVFGFLVLVLLKDK